MEAVFKAISAQISDAAVHIDGDACALQAVVISEHFSGKTALARQQMVMQAVRPLIDDGTLHALSLRTYTPVEWRTQPSKQ